MIFPSKRSIRFWWQRRTRGWDDSETWNLDATISRFILPRLKRYKEIDAVHPAGMASEKWNAYLDEMIFAFEFYASDESIACVDRDKVARALRGLRLFARWFPMLWW